MYIGGPPPAGSAPVARMPDEYGPPTTTLTPAAAQSRRMPASSASELRSECCRGVGFG